MSKKTRLEEVIDQTEDYIKIQCKQLLGQIHQKIYEGVKQNNPKLIHNYFEIMNPIFPQLYAKVFNPTTMNNFFQQYKSDFASGLEFVAGITIYYEDQEVGVPCISKDSIDDEIIIVTGQYLRKTHDLQNKSVEMISQEVRTSLKDIMRSLAAKRMKKAYFIFELERILIQIV
jgi:hypothetical protein